MGIKFLSLQMIPGCFHMMGNTCHHHHHHPATTPSPPNTSTRCSSNVRTIKLIRSDGRVKEYHRPVNASELMTEYPKHLICRSDAFYIGQKIPALSEGEELQMGHSYFLLPTHFFQSVLSFVTIASSFARAAAASANRAVLLSPFDIHKTPTGTLQIRVSDEFIERIKEAQEEGDRGAGDGGGGRVCTTAALEKDYKQLVGCRVRQWKPKLETIRESEKRRVGGVAFGGIKRRKKKSQQVKEAHHHKQPSPQQQQKAATIAHHHLINPPPQNS